MRNSVRTGLAAYWAAWADALPTLRKRFPLKTAGVVAELETNYERQQCLKEVLQAAEELRTEGFEVPSYQQLAEELRPEQPTPGEADPGEWRHGWQYFASRAREDHHVQHRIQPGSTRQV